MTPSELAARELRDRLIVRLRTELRERVGRHEGETLLAALEGMLGGPAMAREMWRDLGAAILEEVAIPPPTMWQSIRALFRK